ncbi:hypothetical protein M2164_008427 [Streptomyces sp. SAI-208]|nr:hypothetical protein [Streptomyces sp. SAI-208]MDH6612792.1 hypothetical protein [Streptomyces sp. SAI-208]
MTSAPTPNPMPNPTPNSTPTPAALPFQPSESTPPVKRTAP